MTRPRPIVIPIQGDVAGLQRSLDSIDTRFGRTEAAAHRLGGALVAAFAGDALKRAIAAPIAVAGTYEQALTDVEAVTGANVRQMQQLDRASRAGGLSWGVGATAYARMAGELVRGNVAIDDVADRAGKATAALSIAGNIEIPQAAEAIAKAGNVFKLGGRDFVNLTDYYANFANKTTGTVGSLVQGMASFAGAGRNAFKGLRDDALETVTALALVEQNSGQTGSDAGTTARTALNRLPTQPGQDALRMYNLDFYNAKGQLLDLTGLAREAHKELDGLTDRQRTRALMDLGGADGFRFWKALLEETPADVDRLRASIARQGSAQEVAAKRNEGYSRSLERIKAAREDALITIGEGAAGQLKSAADILTGSLADPQVQAQLQRTGDLLGVAIAGSVERLRDGFADGSIPRALEQVIDIGESAGETLGNLTEVGGQLLDVATAIPGPVLQVATAFAIWRRASLALAGPLGVVGTQAAAASARGAVPPAIGSSRTAQQSAAIAAAAASNATPAGFAARRAALAERRAQMELARQAEQRAAMAADQAAWSRNNLYTAAGGGLGNLALAAQVRGREAEAARLAAAAAERRAAARAVAVPSLLSSLPSRFGAPGRASAGASAAGGAIGAAAADDFLSAIVSGAAVGSVGGPWGAAGGAVAAAAGVGIKKLLANGAQKEAEQLGEQIAGGLGLGASGSRKKDLAQQVKDAEPFRPKTLTPLAPGAAAVPLQGGNAEEWQRRQEKIGRTAAAGLQERFNRKQLIDPEDVKRLTLQAFRGADPAAREAGARSMLAWLRGLEGKKGVAKGAAARLVDDLGGSFDAFAPKAEASMKRVDILRALGSAVGGKKRDIQAMLEANFAQFSGLEKPVKLTYANTVKEAEKQLAVLARKTRTGSAESRKAAADEYQKLARAINEYLGDATQATDRFGREGKRAIGQLGDSMVTLDGKLGNLSSEWRDLAETLSNIDLSKLTPGAPGSDVYGPPAPKPKKGKRAGGYAGGADIAVSPGEGIRMPDGSWFMVPGARVAADSVRMTVPPDAEVYTGHGLALIGAGMSPEAALEVQAPHFGPGSIPGFATGGKVSGRVSHFGGAGDASTRGRKTALGLGPNTPGIAIRPGATVESGRPTLGGYWDVHLAGKHSVLRQIDLGPAPWTKRRIDITSAAIGRFGFTEKTFPTDSIAWAAWLGKDRAAAYARAAKGAGDGSAISSPIMLGRSTRGRGELVAGSFGSGFQLGTSGYTADDLRRFGRPVLGEISQALGAGQYTRQVEQQSSKLRGGAGGGGWLRPVSGPVTSRYGRRSAPTKGASTNHDGIDFGVPVGTPVRAVGAGTVTKAGPNGGYGNYVRIAHRGGYASFYGHLDSISTATGRRVSRGATIARSGNTGTSTGPHLHFGMAKGGRSIDPASVIPMRLGGRVKGYRRGGVVDVGGVNIGRGLQTGGEDFYRRLGEAADDAVYKRVEKAIGQLKLVANGSGDARVIARARASISALESSLGVRVGQSVGRASTAISTRDQNLRATAAVQRIRGIDPNSAEGIRGQQLVLNRFLGEAPAREKELQAAVARAARANERSKGGNKAELDAANEALRNFSTEVLETKASLADLDKQVREQTIAQAEAATSAAASWAELTTGTADDAAVKRQEAQNFRDRAAMAPDEATKSMALANAAKADREAQRLDSQDRLSGYDLAQARADATADPTDNIALAEQTKKIAEEEAAKARARGDNEFETEMLRLAKSQDDTLKGLRADAKAATEATLAVTQGLLEQSNASVRVLQAQAAGQLAKLARPTTAYPNRTPGWL